MKGGDSVRWSEANCMGYALGINRWLCIDDWKYRRPMDIATELAAHYNLKIVKRKDMVKGKIYIVFRKSSVDFHFMKRSKDGHWRHKPGWDHVRSISEKEVFANTWYGSDPWTYYNTTPIVFEVQD